MKTLISIIGPTASGKTALAVQMAKELNTEIVNADSRQVYRELNIGTAKPTTEEMQGVHHHLLDFLPPTVLYSAGRFGKDALIVLEQIWKDHDTAIMVGGSGLYLKAVWEGFDEIPDVGKEIRDALNQEFESAGLEVLAEELKSLDPETASGIDLSNPQRVIRALEVFRATGKPLSSFRSGLKETPGFLIKKIGIDPGREEMYRRINLRVDEMMAKGLLDEVRALDQKYGRKLNALQTVGYQEFWPYFDGEISLETAIETVKQHTRNYAKRQMTWFRRDSGIQWRTPLAAKADSPE